MSELETKLLAILRDEHYQPVKPRVLAKKLGLDEEGARDLKRLIKRMVKRGDIAWGSNHLVTATRTGKAAASGEAGSASAASSNRLVGTFRRNPSGHGKVRLPTKSGEAPPQDVEIAAKHAMDASTGDRVQIRLRNSGSPSGPTGEIVEIVERQNHRFVGTYIEKAGQAVVLVDGRIFSEPLSVGDPGAKNARPNDKVVIEMVRFPSHVHDGEAVIVEVLGQRGEPGVDTLSIIHEFNLPGEFPEDVLDDAHVQADAFNEAIEAPRQDFTGQTIITIDPVDARDFDDAISLEQIEKNHWRLGVHIADVSHFVKQKSALDREALDRATSVYLPDRVVPMLPEIISNNLASLQPDRVRYTLSIYIEFTPEGTRVGSELHRGAIRSKWRFSYEEVDEYLADPEAWRAKLPADVHALVGRMRDLARVLHGRRVERGSLELSMPEVKIDLDADGRVSGAHVVKHTESHRIIEEFMLAANEAVATWLFDKGLIFLRRVHGSPDPRKQKLLTEFIRELGFETDSLESRFAVQKLLDEVKGRPQERAVNYAILRSMQKAVYSPEVEGHYALASEQYCHFTSPIRRYPDLTVHRLVTTLLDGQPPKQDMNQLVTQGEHCSEREQRAEAAERELVKAKLLEYLSTRIGLEMDGVVTGVESFGLFVQGIELPAEGLVHITSLADDFYTFDRASHSLVGRREGNMYRLGDRVRVVVAAVEVDRRVLDFRLVGQEAGKVPRTEGRSPASRPGTKRPGSNRPARPAGPRGHGGSPRDATPPKKGSRPKKKRR